MSERQEAQSERQRAYRAQQRVMVLEAAIRRVVADVPGGMSEGAWPVSMAKLNALREAAGNA